jgi:hypothetical protein
MTGAGADATWSEAQRSFRSPHLCSVYDLVLHRRAVSRSGPCPLSIMTSERRSPRAALFATTRCPLGCSHTVVTGVSGEDVCRNPFSARFDLTAGPTSQTLPRWFDFAADVQRPRRRKLRCTHMKAIMVRLAGAVISTYGAVEPGKRLVPPDPSPIRGTRYTVAQASRGATMRSFADMTVMSAGACLNQWRHSTHIA